MATIKLGALLKISSAARSVSAISGRCFAIAVKPLTALAPIQRTTPFLTFTSGQP